MDVIRKEVGRDSASDEEWEELFQEFDRDGGLSAYVFRCKHCGTLGGFWDCDSCDGLQTCRSWSPVRAVRASPSLRPPGAVLASARFANPRRI